MSEFLQLISPADALKRLIDNLPDAPRRGELVKTVNACGRVIISTVISNEALPAFSRSTVDGYAVRAADTYGASESLPVYLSLVGEVPMGSAPEIAISRSTAAVIHTGGMLPDGADAVVMLENTQISKPGELEVLRGVGLFENILKAGEDITPGQEVLPAGTLLRPPEIGGLMALGMTEIEVVVRPKVAILSSGDEIVSPEEHPQPGQVRDVNSYSLSALVSEAGGNPIRHGVVADRVDAMTEAMQTALSDCDMVLVTAGSSASARDLTADVINQIGKPGVLVHGVNVKPGKPTILAVCNGKSVVGLPGNPVSALVISRLFVRPIITRWLGIRNVVSTYRVRAILALNLASQAGREDYVPVKLVYSDSGWVAEPIFYKSNLIFTLAQADGLARIPADETGLPAGSIIEIDLLHG